jgi:hypothetical protein
MKILLILIMAAPSLWGQVSYNSIKFCWYDEEQDFICSDETLESNTFIDVHTKTGYKMVIKNSDKEQYRMDIKSVDFLRQSDEIYGKIFTLQEGTRTVQLIVQEQRGYSILIMKRDNKEIYVVYSNIY